ncbi:hypothetical protein [Streptosporangium sp. NPDC000396]|uniref:hypothetical protein n=1 Tax=Streptosporangium sp. NPDC000396 TaxID=3366185 RepID=UPI0036791052
MNRSLLFFEAGRLLRSPILWGAALAALAMGFAQSAAWLPDMTMVTIDTITASTLVGAAVMIVTNLAAGRDRRHGLPETLGALPGRAAPRTRAVVLAAPAVGALAAAAMISAHLLVVSLSDSVAGRFDPYEALGGVALAALAASAGAALGRWTPWLIVPPILIAAMAFGMLGNSRAEIGGWFLPVIPGHNPEWGARPTEQHLIYLVAGVVFLASVALLRHGLRPVRTVVALTALAVAVPAGAAATAAAPILPWTPHFTPQLPEQVCENHEGLSYCVYPDYKPWIPNWARALRPILSAVPERARDRIPVIRQKPVSAIHSSEDIMGEPGTWLVWSTDPAQHQAMLIGQVAAAVAGLGGGCHDVGRARTVVALWLAGRAEPLLDAPPPGAWSGSEGEGGWLRVSMTYDGGEIRIPGQLGGPSYGAAEVGYARRLLERPDAADRVRANWDTLTAPETTVEQALPLLGLRPEFPATPKDDQCR